MSEVLVEFNVKLRGETGSLWTPRACGRLADDGLWEGWLEFIPNGPTDKPVRSGRETEQHDRNGVLYWAQGLTQVYLEGSLKRALAPVPKPARPAQLAAEPIFDGPRPHSGAAAMVTGRRPVLNPFEVHQQGEDILASELSALRAPRLRDIAIEFGFASVADAGAATEAQLAAMILAGVRRGRPAANGEARRADLSA